MKLRDLALLASRDASLDATSTIDATLACSEIARPLVIAGLAERWSNSTLVVATPTGTAAQMIHDDLVQYVGAANALLFPAWETLPFERVSPSVESMGRRLEVLWRLRTSDQPRIVVGSVRALLQKLAPGATTREPIVVRRGTDVNADHRYVAARLSTRSEIAAPLIERPAGGLELTLQLEPLLERRLPLVVDEAHREASRVLQEEGPTDGVFPEPRCVPEGGLGLRGGDSEALVHRSDPPGERNGTGDRGSPRGLLLGGIERGLGVRLGRSGSARLAPMEPTEQPDHGESGPQGSDPSCHGTASGLTPSYPARSHRDKRASAPRKDVVCAPRATVMYPLGAPGSDDPISNGGR